MNRRAARPLRLWLRAGEAAATLACARLLVRTRPVERAARLMAAGGGGRAAVGAGDPAEAGVVRAVAAAARRAPFRAMCLEQALAASRMLARRGIAATLHLGTASGEDGFAAHAWISVAGRVVLGGPIERYTERARF